MGLEMSLEDALAKARNGAAAYPDVPSVSRTLLAHIAALEADAALGAAVRPYFTSANSVYVERAVIRRADIAHVLGDAMESVAAGLRGRG